MIYWRLPTVMNTKKGESLLTIFRQFESPEYCFVATLSKYTAVRNYLHQNKIETGKGRYKSIQLMLARLSAHGDINDTSEIEFLSKQYANPAPATPGTSFSGASSTLIDESRESNNKKRTILNIDFEKFTGYGKTLLADVQRRFNNY